MVVENTTPNRGYQLPHETNDLADDVSRLIAAIMGIDVEIAAMLVAIASKADAEHDHVIANITGLAAALAARQELAQKGEANGYASLGADGKVPSAQLPSALFGGLAYQGTWNASTNSPTIPAAAAGNKGHYYKVSVAGTTTVSGINDWQVNDWIVSNGTTWDKIDNTDDVQASAIDTTPGKLMAVGAFGIGAQVVSTETNLHNYTTPGFYISPSSGLTNLPGGFDQARYHVQVYGGVSYGMIVITDVARPWRQAFVLRSGGAYGTWVPMINSLGGTFTNIVQFVAATTTQASIRIPPGVAPDAPVDGDVWGQSTGLRYRRSGVTYQVWDTGSLLKMPQAEANTGSATTARVVDAATIFGALVRNRRVSRKTADQSFATSTLADVTGLSFSAEANEVWAFEAEVLFEKTSEAYAYPDVAVNGPAGAYIRGALHIEMHQSNDLFGENALITAFDQRPFTLGVAGAVPGMYRVYGYVAMGATAGTVIIRGARNTVAGAGTATIKDGSILKAYRIA